MRTALRLLEFLAARFPRDDHCLCLDLKETDQISAPLLSARLSLALAAAGLFFAFRPVPEPTEAGLSNAATTSATANETSGDSDTASDESDNSLTTILTPLPLATPPFVPTAEPTPLPTPQTANTPLAESSATPLETPLAVPPAGQ